MHNRKGMTKITTITGFGWWRWQDTDSGGVPAWSWPRTL